MSAPDWIAETLSWVDWPKDSSKTKESSAKPKANGGGK
jgi:hypothetical protein